ncbi:hypothetical protein [Chondromyces apiculatus]|uniref:Calcineurin-like phosphoesterase domain-containing protein n=1 Tax=Chondromyces apiculatus DSM 436 TaxID=1192034 RepID=A0A017T6K8_9BACT|nr:hypothetical protein [Chondromyces apiculatus]EYF04632.1 Hypothetical protein CAP_4308 [Chondromyces apiculatus DSM 436]
MYYLPSCALTSRSPRLRAFLRFSPRFSVLRGAPTPRSFTVTLAAHNRPPALVTLAPAPADEPHLRFRRGRRSPRAIAWLGAKSFWGHIWHLVASVIATEDIDSRDWMRPDDPEAFTARVAGELGAFGASGAAGAVGAGRGAVAESLTEALGGDLWIDFVADTGDDVSVSTAVAEMIFAAYDVEDATGERLTLPRGHLLLFGGDTAYPVATELEIHNRVIAPWNAVLRGAAEDGVPRVLLGVPGNHDWYAGLDGFGRMFRARRGTIDRASRVMPPPSSASPPLSTQPRPREGVASDAGGNIGHFIAWVEAFSVGTLVAKRPALPLEGYTPVQTASYWALHLAPGMTLWGPDRQLRAVDFQQRLFFAEARAQDPSRGIVLCMADPVRAYLEPSRAGTEMLAALDLSLAHDGPLVLTGDTHHYCRETIGEGMHVIAGGGGAFLHPARIARRGFTPPQAEFPGPRASLSLALRIPFEIARGRSGFLVHIGIALLYVPTILMALDSGLPGMRMAAATAVVCWLLAWAIGGWRTGEARTIGGLALLTGVGLGFLPVLAAILLGPVLRGVGVPPWGVLLSVAAVAVALGAFLFGAYLTALTLLGLEQHQAFSALAHPGYKHFVRLRVRRDGSAIDGWVLGKVDPLAADEKPTLVDRFTWRNPGHSPSS